MQAPNHKRNAVRFAIVLFWLVITGIVYSVATYFSSATLSLGWPTYLFHGSLALILLYAGVFVTKSFWSIK